MYARLKNKRARDDVLGRVSLGLVGCKALDGADRAEQVIQKVQLVRCQVHETPATRQFRNDPPGQCLGIEILRA